METSKAKRRRSQQESTAGTAGFNSKVKYLGRIWTVRRRVPGPLDSGKLLVQLRLDGTCVSRFVEPETPVVLMPERA